jgi:sulfate permease, SulP family
LQDVIHLLPAAVGIFLVSFADEILTARSFAGKHNQHVRASQELLAMGAANAAAGFTQGFSVGASGSRTAVNDGMGARSQVAGLIAAITVLIILLFLTEPVQYLPKAVLGAVIVFAAIGLVEPAAWRALAAVDHVEVAIAAVTTGCVVVLGVLEALAVAVGLSIIDTVRRSASPHDAVLGWVARLGRYADVSLHRTARLTPGVLVYRLDDRLFFANARYFKGGACAKRSAPLRRRCCSSSSTQRPSHTWTRPGSTRSTSWRRTSVRTRSRLSLPGSGHVWRNNSRLPESPRRSAAIASTLRYARP